MSSGINRLPFSTKQPVIPTSATISFTLSLLAALILFLLTLSLFAPILLDPSFSLLPLLDTLGMVKDPRSAKQLLDTIGRITYLIGLAGSLLAFIVGNIALHQIKNSPLKFAGRGKALAGTMIGGLFFLLTLLGGIIAVLR